MLDWYMAPAWECYMVSVSYCQSFGFDGVTTASPRRDLPWWHSHTNI